MVNAEIHRDKPMSVEAAKLLGLPFTWGKCVYACKFVRTDGGVEPWARGIVPNNTVPCDVWSRFTHVKPTWVLPKHDELVLVTFPDDAQMLEQR